MLRHPDTVQVGGSGTHCSSNLWLTYVSLLSFYRSFLIFVMSELLFSLSFSNMPLLEVPHVESPHPSPCYSMMALCAFLWKQAAA